LQNYDEEIISLCDGQRIAEIVLLIMENWALLNKSIFKVEPPFGVKICDVLVSLANSGVPLIWMFLNSNPI